METLKSFQDGRDLSTLTISCDRYAVKRLPDTFNAWEFCLPPLLAP